MPSRRHLPSFRGLPTGSVTQIAGAAGPGREGSPSVSVPPGTAGRPLVAAARGARGRGARRHSATGARKLRKKLAALTGMHPRRARSKAPGKAKEKLAKRKSNEPPPAEPAWSAGDEAPTDDAPGVAIPAAHDVSPPRRGRRA